MQACETKPWKLLLTKMRRSDNCRVSYAEVAAAGLKPDLLVRERLMRYGDWSDYEHPECEDRCELNLNWDMRRDEGLVGVACPREPPCWHGWAWVPKDEIESLRCLAKDVLAVLATRAGLAPLEGEIPQPFTPVGVLRRRGMTLPVVWMRGALYGFEQLCRGLRMQLGGDGLVVLMPKVPRTAFSPTERILLLELPAHGRPDLELVRALDILVPEHRRLVLTDPMLDLDYARIRFATIAGQRHVVEINGHDFEGFRRSDVKFLRLLLLAAARKQGANDGWIDKYQLRDGDDKDRALERLREELAEYPAPGLSDDELKAVIRSQRGQGLLRLGIPPENIEFDASLGKLEFVAPLAVNKKSGAKGKPTAKQEDGIKTATLLFGDCQRLGIPGNPSHAL